MEYYNRAIFNLCYESRVHEIAEDDGKYFARGLKWLNNYIK